MRADLGSWLVREQRASTANGTEPGVVRAELCRKSAPGTHTLSPNATLNRAVLCTPQTRGSAESEVVNR